MILSLDLQKFAVREYKKQYLQRVCYINKFKIKTLYMGKNYTVLCRRKKENIKMQARNPIGTRGKNILQCLKRTQSSPKTQQKSYKINVKCHLFL